MKAIGELFLEHEKLYKEDKKAERKRMYLHHIFNLQSLFLHSIVCARLNNMFLELVDIMKMKHSSLHLQEQRKVQ